MPFVVYHCSLFFPFPLASFFLPKCYVLSSSLGVTVMIPSRDDSDRTAILRLRIYLTSICQWSISMLMAELSSSSSAGPLLMSMTPWHSCSKKERSIFQSLHCCGTGNNQRMSERNGHRKLVMKKWAIWYLLVYTVIVLAWTQLLGMSTSWHFLLTLCCGGHVRYDGPASWFVLSQRKDWQVLLSQPFYAAYVGVQTMPSTGTSPQWGTLVNPWVVLLWNERGNLSLPICWSFRWRSWGVTGVFTKRSSDFTRPNGMEGKYVTNALQKEFPIAGKRCITTSKRIIIWIFRWPSSWLVRCRLGKSDILLWIQLRIVFLIGCFFFPKDNFNSTPFQD